MPGPLAAAAPAIGIAALGGAASLIGTERTNLANARQAREQMAFQERMSSTAWQRGVEDMRKAGLNPALAYEKGGASSPSGAMATMEDSLSKGVSSAQEAASMHSRLKSDQVNRVVAASQALKAGADAKLADEQAETMRQHRELIGNEIWTRTQESSARGQLASSQYGVSESERRYRDRMLEHELERIRVGNRLSATSAREMEQRMRIQELMTPSAWSARIQRDYLPFVSTAAEVAGIGRDIGIGYGALRRGLFDRVPETARPRIGF